MNTKIVKLQAEREKNVGKITSLQTRNREIDGQITELENLDIVGIVRDNGITPEMLAEIIKAMKQKPLPVSDAYHEETEETADEN